MRIASYNVMQSHAIDVEELADRRIAPAPDQFKRHVGQHQSNEQQKNKDKKKICAHLRALGFSFHQSRYSKAIVKKFVEHFRLFRHDALLSLGVRDQHGTT